MYWTCDRLVSNNLRDHTGNGFSGKAESVNTSDGVINGALLFSEKGSKVVINKDFTPSDSGTICFWMKVSNIELDKNHRVISSNASQFEISIREGYLTNELFADSTTFLQDTTMLKTAHWYHIACTWNSATKENVIYFDGKLRVNGTYADDRPPETITITLGASILHGIPFKGLLDEIRVYNRILTLTQIQALADKAF